LYRTNPSIPVPESKYGTRSDVYEQILSLKQHNLDSNGKFKNIIEWCIYFYQMCLIALVVWQPEDVLLVRDLMNLENEPLNEVLQCLPLRAETDEEPIEYEKVNVNVNITAMGRPINNHPHVRWKQIEAIINDYERDDPKKDDYEGKE
jgi:hypothetical protein